MTLAKLTAFRLMLMLLIITALFQACSNTSALTNAVNNTMPADEVYLVTKIGEKIDGTELRVKGFAIADGKLMLDGREYPIASISQFQNKHGYFVSFNNVWYKRIYKGRIEAFAKTRSYSGIGASPSQPSAYIVKSSGEMVAYNSQNLYKLISDDKSATSVFNRLYSKLNDKTPWDNDYKNLIKVLDAYQYTSGQNLANK